MAVTIVLEDAAWVGVEDPDITANSWVDLAYADAYVERRPAPNWDVSSDDVKTRRLVWAAELFMYYIVFDGRIVHVDQPLSFPRVGCYDAEARLIASNVIPEQLKRAQTEMARYAAIKDRTAEAASRGWSQVSFGEGLGGTVDLPSAVGVIPDHVLVMLWPFGRLRESAGPGGVRRMRIDRVVRA